jgi:hypothetical protein
MDIKMRSIRSNMHRATMLRRQLDLKCHPTHPGNQDGGVPTGAHPMTHVTQKLAARSVVVKEKNNSNSIIVVVVDGRNAATTATISRQ